MRIVLLTIGKTDSHQIVDLMAIYVKRLNNYLPFTIEMLPDIKRSAKMPTNVIKQKEGEDILRYIEPSDYIILFDERGKSYTSKGFAGFLQSTMNGGYKRIIFLIGGAYGFSSDVYKRANSLITLSSMTFSHQMVRLFAVEQIYRAFTIIHNEPYHHE